MSKQANALADDKNINTQKNVNSGLGMLQIARGASLPALSPLQKQAIGRQSQSAKQPIITFRKVGTAD